MVRISTPFVNAEYSIVPAETRSVQVSEEGYTVTINENADGDVVITGLEELPPAQAELLSGALSIWKYGLIEVPEDYEE